jgi:hypothetical protein
MPKNHSAGNEDNFRFQIEDLAQTQNPAPTQPLLINGDSCGLSYMSSKTTGENNVGSINLRDR